VTTHGTIRYVRHGFLLVFYSNCPQNAPFLRYSTSKCCLFVLELRPMCTTDRRKKKASLNASALWVWRHNKNTGQRTSNIHCMLDILMSRSNNQVHIYDINENVTEKNYSCPFFSVYSAYIIVMNEWNSMEFVWCQQRSLAIQNETSCWGQCFDRNWCWRHVDP